MRVLFTTTPGRGHFHPMVPLAGALLDDGHDVAWVAAEHVCAQLRSEGFEAMAAGLAEDAGMAEFARRHPEVRDLPPPERPAFMFPRLFGPLRVAPMLDELLPIARDWRPSLIVHEQAELAAPIAAAVLGVPNVVHAFGSLLPKERVATAGDLVAPLWEAHGLRPRGFAGAYDHLYVDIYPPSLQSADMPHLPAVQPIRPVTFAAGGDEDAPGWLTETSAQPLVYVTFGTVFNRDVAVVKAAVEGLRDLPVRVLVTLGPGRDPAGLGDQPENVRVARYIAQTAVLPHCAAVVSHAGSGTFLAALARGLPQLMLPQAADQFLNAAAGVRAGAGIAIAPHELSAERVRDDFERLLADASYRRAAEELRDEIAAMPAPAAVAAQIAQRFG